MIYSLFNLFLVPLTVMSLALLRLTSRQLLAARVALTATLLAHPWLLVGSELQAWAYNDPGPVLLGVPINDLVLCFQVTLISASLLISNRREILHKSRSKAQSKKGGQESA